MILETTWYNLTDILVNKRSCIQVRCYTLLPSEDMREIFEMEDSPCCTMQHLDLRLLVSRTVSSTFLLLILRKGEIAYIVYCIIGFMNPED